MPAGGGGPSEGPGPNPHGPSLASLERPRRIYPSTPRHFDDDQDDDANEQATQKYLVRLPKSPEGVKELKKRLSYYKLK